MERDQNLLKKLIREVIEYAEEPLALTNREEATTSPYLKFLSGLLELNLEVLSENRVLATRYLCALKFFIPKAGRTSKLHMSLNRVIRYLLLHGGV